MGAGRVTQQMLVTKVIGNLHAHSQRILDLQEQLSTGRKINRPSDDALAVRRATSARRNITQNDQFVTNISSIGPQLVETETSVSNAIDIMQRAYELALQGASTTNGQIQLDSIATEVNELLEGLYRESNHMTGGRYVFGGTRTMREPFVATRDASGTITSVAYTGNSDHYSVDIDRSSKIVVNETGDELFMQTSVDSVDLFQSLIDLRDNLNAGDTNSIQTRIDETDKGQSQLSLSLARVGTRVLRTDRVVENLLESVVQSKQVLSDNVDADFSEVILSLTAQENALRASLNAGARVIQPSLLDFMR